MPLPHSPRRALSDDTASDDEILELDGSFMADSRRALMDEIERHSKAIIDLKSRLNTMTPIARLPTELLSNVFVLLSRDYYETYRAGAIHDRYYPDYTRPSACLKLTHVCRSWRTIALDTPRMWSFLALSRDHAWVLDESRCRSKKAPLYVTAILSPSDTQKRKVLDDIILSDFERLRELSIASSTDIVMEACQKVSGSANFLEAIHLRASESHIGRVKFSTSLPHTFSQQQLPRLRHVEIRHLRVTWSNPIFCASLTELVIHGRGDHLTQMGSFADMLSVLEGMTSLQVLELINAIPPLPLDASSLPDAERKISFSYLKFLCLQANSVDCANLLNHLNIPPTTRFDLSSSIPTSVPVMNVLAGILRDHLSKSEPLRTACLSRVSPVWQSLRLECWRTAVQGTTMPTSPCDFKLNISASGDLETLFRDSGILRGIHTLKTFSSHLTERWDNMFLATPEIRVLLVEDNQSRQLFDTLAKLDTVGGEASESLFLPHLEMLQLADMRLLSLDLINPRNEVLDWLVDALITRCNYGVPVQKLLLTRCKNTTEEDVNRLREIVPEVEWDGIEEFEEEEIFEDEEMYSEDSYDDPFYDDPYYADDFMDVAWGLW